MASKSQKTQSVAETNEQEMERLQRELDHLNIAGRRQVNLMFNDFKKELCKTRYAQQLARKLAKRYPNTRFLVAVEGETYNDSDFGVVVQPFYNDVLVPSPPTRYQLEQAMAKAKAQINALQELPSFTQLQLYATGVCDALKDAEDLRNELEKVKKSLTQDRSPMMMVYPMWR